MVFLYIVECTLIALLLVVEEIAQTAEELEIQRLRKEAEELKSQLNTQNNNNNEEDHTKNDTI